MNFMASAACKRQKMTSMFIIIFRRLAFVLIYKNDFLMMNANLRKVIKRVRNGNCLLVAWNWHKKSIFESFSRIACYPIWLNKIGIINLRFFVKKGKSALYSMTFQVSYLDFCIASLKFDAFQIFLGSTQVEKSLYRKGSIGNYIFRSLV